MFLFNLVNFVSGNTTYYNASFGLNVHLEPPALVIEKEDTRINASVQYLGMSVGDQNFTFYYVFKQREYFYENWTTIACVEGNDSVSIVYNWNIGTSQSPSHECLVELYSPDCGLLDNDTASVRIAG